ncbi:MAG: hypothetical protein ACE5OS_11995 [Anaerolineae bacterium]
MRTSAWENIRERVYHAAHTAGEILYGMTIFDWLRGMRQQRGEIERLFVLVTFGDIVGLPILPPYYTLRLLPYIVPTLNRWKRGLLRERDLTDLAELIEGVD